MVVTGFPDEYHSHDVVALEGPSRNRLADGDVEERLTEPGDVHLGAVVEALVPLPLEGVDDFREGGFVGFDRVCPFASERRAPKFG